jgi:hypothetical protein
VSINENVNKGGAEKKLRSGLLLKKIKCGKFFKMKNCSLCGHIPNFPFQRAFQSLKREVPEDKGMFT